jgi:hypothetical protein
MEKFYKRIITKTSEEGTHDIATTYPPATYKKPIKEKEKVIPPPKVHKPKNNHQNEMTISEKRELCQDIKKLPK